ncbi:SLC13 family permease [Oribacterium sp. WCC10]|uniref:SLC13 family permease n=1 Tax=Oribacterium sp. WCC10 TaxID=1855343 RepID=UPI0008E70FD3|nr:SLC13 family permease [Oribacterium sp. WCC10]SFG69043.1 anion transporter [Oribacterium sp. WCC10]
MNTQIVITLCILAFMVVMLLTHKLPYGLTAMICCTAFVLTGVSDIKTAFSGFSSSTAIMVAAMIVVATQLSKTSVVQRLKNVMYRMQGKGEMLVLLTLALVTLGLSQFMGQVACISIMLLFVQTLQDDAKVTPAKALMAVCTINTLWTSKIPVAMGATMPGTINAFFEGVAPEYAIGIADYFKVALIPGILGLIYCVACVKLIPDSDIKREEVSIKEVKVLSKKHETVVFVVFAVIMGAFFLSNVISKEVQNVIPVAGVLALMLTGVISLEDVQKTICSDMIFLIAGMSAVSTILGNTGVGELIGQTVLKILGGHPAPMFVIAVFCIVTSVMTNFLSNMGTMALMIPIAASTALAGGFNVQTVVLVTAASSWMAFVLPTGCAGSMIAFGTGNFNVGQTLKFTLPLFIIEVVSLIVSATMFFPIYS